LVKPPPLTQLAGQVAGDGHVLDVLLAADAQHGQHALGVLAAVLHRLLDA
jgi:hypothetical protein